MHDTPMTPEQQSKYEYEKAPETMGRYVSEVDIHNKTVVDFGCGWGGESLWLLHQGAGKVIGIDIEESSLEQARKFSGPSIDFFTSLSNIPKNSVDFVFSTDVFEHVMDIPTILDQIKDVLKPGGALISKFGPLFYTPYGCHFYWAKLFPYSHLIMGRKWLVRRIDKIRGYQSNTKSWQEMGLNQMVFENFSREATKRFELKRLNPVTILNLPSWTASIPFFNRYLIFGCDIHAIKPKT